ncbi:MAG: cell wall-binding repeat-containing protein [Lachnospiraceae bacterium]|nr:cell wall-binding repeat-containing protein [Lachnospiraceae bacterium]
MRRKMLAFALALIMAVPGAGFTDVKMASADTSVPITDQIFKDDVLRKYVKDNYDSNNDGSLSSDEIAMANYMTISGLSVKSLDGIEYLTELTNLTGENCKLTKLDLSGNPALRDVNCNGNFITEVNLSNNANLSGLSLDNNKVSSIDLSKCTGLRDLYIDNNKLTALNVRSNKELSSFYCCNNQIAKLDVSGLTALSHLECDNNHMTSLNLNGCSKMQMLSCGNNNLTTIDLSSCKMLIFAGLSMNNLSSVDVSMCPSLSNLYINNNNISDINLNSNTNLVFLNCNDNNLAGLNLTYNTKLKTLYCNYNNISALDLTKMSLSSLYCDCGVVVSGTAQSKTFRHRYSTDAWTKDFNLFKQNCKECNVVSSRIERVYGIDRFETSMYIADCMKKDKFSTIVVACGTNYADALSGSYLAYLENAPILLTANNGEVLGKTLMYISDNLKEDGKVYILGGKGVVPESLENSLVGFGINTERLAGADRYETNLKILQEIGLEYSDKLLVCTGREFADSLSASAVPAPILLVPSRLTDAQKAYLDFVDVPEDIFVIGGEGAVTNYVEEALDDYGNVERVFGMNRFETSVEIAERFFGDVPAVAFAYSQNFPDGLAAGPFAASHGCPLILTTNSEKWLNVAEDYLHRLYYQNFTHFVFGGPTLITDENMFRLAS